MKKNFSVIIFYLVVIALIVLVSSQLLGRQSTEKCTYSQVEQFFEEDLVKKYQVSKSYQLKLEVYVKDTSSEDGLVRDEDGKITNKTQLYSYQLSGLSLYKFDRNVDT